MSMPSKSCIVCFILGPRDSAAFHAAIGGHIRFVSGKQGLLQGAEKGLALRLGWLWLLLRRHLAIAHTVKDPMPGFEVRSVIEIKGGDQVQASLFTSASSHSMQC